MEGIGRFKAILIGTYHGLSVSMGNFVGNMAQRHQGPER